MNSPAGLMYHPLSCSSVPVAVTDHLWAAHLHRHYPQRRLQLQKGTHVGAEFLWNFQSVLFLGIWRKKLYFPRGLNLHAVTYLYTQKCLHSSTLLLFTVMTHVHGSNLHLCLLCDVVLARDIRRVIAKHCATEQVSHVPCSACYPLGSMTHLWFSTGEIWCLGHVLAPPRPAFQASQTTRYSELVSTLIETFKLHKSCDKT